MTEIRPLSREYHSGIEIVVESLPEWFDETAQSRSIPMDIQHQDGFVAVFEGQVTGFVTLYDAEGRLHIGWLGVHADYQRRGIGTKLVAAAELKARDLGIEELATYTLGDCVDYAPYELTRRFYRKCGFRVYKRSRTDNPGCPEEIWLSKHIDGP